MSGARERLAAVFTAMWEAEAGEPLDELDVFAEARDGYVDALLPVVQALVAEGEKRGRAEAVEESRQFCARSGGCIS